MSIGRRFLHLARTELNSLLDFAAKRGDGDSGQGDDDGDGADESAGGSLHGYSARELEEELERRRAARQEVEDAIHGRRTPEPPPRPSNSPGAGSAGGRGDRTWSGVGAGEGLRIQKAYAALEVPAGSDFATVRKAYRTLMRKYHPDHHTESPAKQKAANEVAQRLTESYKLLERKLRK